MCSDNEDPCGFDFEKMTFGSSDPKAMPGHLFRGAKRLDYSSAIRANVAVQDYTVCPRHWYVDATFLCEACKREFNWTAAEQRTWFEEYRFYIDSIPTRCPECRRQRRQKERLQKEYDTLVASARSGRDLEAKKRVIALVDQIEATSSRIPDRMRVTRDLLKRQIRKADPSE
jgi:hypothetical protein